MTEPLLVVENLHKAFPVRRRFGEWLGREPPRSLAAVDGVSFSVPRGHVLGVVGESGCGKTTLARCILRLIEPDSGRVELGGEDLLAMPHRELRRLRKRIQVVFQDPYTSLNPRLSIGDAIGEAALVHGVVSKREVAAQVRELLELVGLPSSATDRRPAELSGGQRQRVAIARALAVKPEVLVADEAVSALDVSIQAQILNLLRRLTDELGLATIFIAHQLAVVAHVSDAVAVMYLGQIVEYGPTERIFSTPRHPYTAALLAAHPEPIAERRRASVAISGEIPSPLDIQAGCRFRTRCPYREDACSADPPVAEFEEGQTARCVVLPFVYPQARATPTPAGMED